MSDFSNHMVVQALGWMLVHSLWLLLIPAVVLALVLLTLPTSWSRSRYFAGVVTLLLIAVIPAASLRWIDVDEPSQQDDLTDPAIETADANPGDVTDLISSEFASEINVFEDAPETSLASPMPTELQIPSPSPDDDDVKATVLNVTPAETTDRNGNRVTEAVQPVIAETQDVPALADRVRPWLPWLVVAWFVGALLMTSRLLAGWRTARRLRKAGQSPVPDAIQNMFVELRASIGASRAARVVQSALVKVPSVVGHFQPIVLLPICAVMGLNERQLRAILAHELAHVKRYDYAVNVLQTVIETVLFYHPAMWWVSRIIRTEREHCCDDIALSVQCEPAELARALVAVDAVRLAEPTTSFSDVLVSAADGGNLLRRIRRISGEPDRRLPSRRSWIAGLVVLSLLAAVASASMLVSNADENTAEANPPAVEPDVGTLSADDAADPSSSRTQPGRIEFANGYFIELSAIGDYVKLQAENDDESKGESNDTDSTPRLWNTHGEAVSKPLNGVQSTYSVGDNFIGRKFYVHAGLPEGSQIELLVDGKKISGNTTSPRAGHPLDIRASVVAELPEDRRSVDVVVELKLPAWQTLAAFDFAGGVNNGIRLDWEQKISPETKYTATGNFRGADADDLRIVALDRAHQVLKPSGHWRGENPLKIGAHFPNENGRPNFVSVQRRLPSRKIVFRNVPLHPDSESGQKTFSIEIDGVNPDTKEKNFPPPSLTTLLHEPRQPMQVEDPDMGMLTLRGLRKFGSHDGGWSADGTPNLQPMPDTPWAGRETSDIEGKQHLEAVFEMHPEQGTQVTNVRVRPDDARATTAWQPIQPPNGEASFLQVASSLRIFDDRETDDFTVHVSTDDWQDPVTISVSPTPDDFEFGRAAYYRLDDNSQTIAFRTDDPSEPDKDGKSRQRFVVIQPNEVNGVVRISAVTEDGRKIDGRMNSFSTRRMFIHFDAVGDAKIKSLVVQLPTTHTFVFRNVSMWKNLGTRPFVERESSDNPLVAANVQPSRVFRQTDGTLISENGEAVVIKAVQEIERRGGRLRFDAEDESPTGERLAYLTEVRWEGFADDETPLLQALSGLNRVKLATDHLTNDGLTSIEHMTGLQRLTIAHTSKLTTKCLRSIGKLTALRELTIPGTLMPDDDGYHSDDFDHLANLTKLVKYEPMNWRLDDAGLWCLRNAKNLEMVYTFGPEVTDVGFAALAGKPKLGVIHLHETKITDVSYKLLENHPKLYWLQCSSPHLTDAAIDSAITIRNLRDLHLYGSKVTDAGVERLIAAVPKLPNLRLVNLSNTQVSQAVADKLRSARKGLRVLGGVDDAPASEDKTNEKTDEANAAAVDTKQKTVADGSSQVQAAAPTDVPWPVERFKSFADYPPSGSGIRVKINDRRWIELNSLANAGRKIGERELKMFWQPDGTLIDPPDDFDPLALVPRPEDGRMPKVNREAALQIVAPQGSRFALNSGGGSGSYGNFSVPVNEDFVQFPIQYVIAWLNDNHTYIEAKVTDGTWEDLPIAGGNGVQVVVFEEARRVIVIADRPQDFAWQVRAQGGDDDPVVRDPFINGVEWDSGFLNDFRDKLPAFPPGHEATLFAFDKNKPMPKMLALQRSEYDVVRFDNLAVFPGPKSAVKVSVNGLPVSKADRLTFSDPDDTPPIVPPSATRKNDGIIELEGTVVDANGDPVKDCWVGMFVEPQDYYGGKTDAPAFGPRSRFVFEATTDPNGRFLMVVNKDHFVFEGSFWAIHEDGTSGTLRMNCTWPHLQKNLNLKLVDAIGKVKIVDPDGQPVVGAEVTPESFSKPRSVRNVLPARVRQKLVETTDETGTVEFLGWPSAGIRGVSVKTDAYGTQYLSGGLASQWVKDDETLKLTLQPTASLTGRVNGFDAQRDAGLQLQILTEAWGGPKPPMYGRAIVEIAEDGSFTVPQIAAGRVKLASSLSPESKRKIRFDYVPELKAGEERVITHNPEIVRGVRVRQRLVKSDTGEGCSGIRLRILWGDAAKGGGSWNSSKPTMTDEEGWWEATVLPGTINARISGLPDGYRGTAWFDGRNGYLGVKHVIPATDKVVTLPPERYVPAKEMNGRLLLPDGSPAVDWSAYGHSISWDDVGVGGVHTDRNGEFTWTYPVGYPPRLFEVSNRKWLTEHNFEDNKAYPKIVSKNPLVLQVPKQELE
ncbi:M56 family metallopeptidase [Thalassoroseus pseudoceratinae]|uniref:M56 family metallopeptidase n=1 Tax=Thalassoroseus pseudoceratinae TaxID=2713176 RepID=UPI0014242561|nr:M56 family metallopeptidase [Thalassoroseus pseudoceratinae]